MGEQRGEWVERPGSLELLRQDERQATSPSEDPAWLEGGAFHPAWWGPPMRTCQPVSDLSETMQQDRNGGEG